MRHVNPPRGLVEQDAREVRTKFAKTFTTWFMTCCDGELEIVTDWIGELERDHLWGPGDQLFPATRIGLDATGSFKAQGLGDDDAHPRHIQAGVRGGGPALFQSAQFPRYAGEARHGTEHDTRRDES